jgi:hypothetical protein
LKCSRQGWRHDGATVVYHDRDDVAPQERPDDIMIQFDRLADFKLHDAIVRRWSDQFIARIMLRTWG